MERGQLGLNPTTPLYSRRRVPISKPAQVQESEPGTGSSHFPFFVDYEQNSPDSSNFDLPIVVRKGTGQCTQQPISPFGSFNRLSLQHKPYQPP